MLRCCHFSFCLISFFIVDIYYVSFFCSVFMHRVHHLVEIIALWNINRTLKRLYWVKWTETGCFNTARTGEKSRLTAELHRPETSRLLLLLRCLCGTSAGQELLLEISIFFFSCSVRKWSRFQSSRCVATGRQMLDTFPSDPWSYLLSSTLRTRLTVGKDPPSASDMFAQQSDIPWSWLQNGWLHSRTLAVSMTKCVCVCVCS